MRSCLALALAVLSGLAAAAQDRVPHRPLFPPQDLGILEGPDRDAWQMPDEVMDALGIADGAMVPTSRRRRRSLCAWRGARPSGRVYAQDIQRR